MRTPEQKARRKVYNAANREAFNAKRQAYRRANPDKLAAQNRQYYLSHPGKKAAQSAASNLRRKHGLTVDLYEALLFCQDYRCKCCGRHETEFSQKLHVDHDHLTGKMRGLLCLNCNHAIGLLGDDENGVSQALVYLQRAKRDATRVLEG